MAQTNNRQSYGMEFWKLVACSMTAFVVGFVGGNAPLAWRNLVTREDLDSASPWMRDRPIMERRVTDTEVMAKGNLATLQLMQSSISRLDGNVQTMLELIRQQAIIPDRSPSK